MINAGPCYKCHEIIYLPDELYHAAKRSEAIFFWCPYGHQQHFAEGETVETKLRRERDRLIQQQAHLNDELAEQRLATEKAEAKTKRLMRRAAHGVCPCCNRTFADVARHMKFKHPNIEPLRKPA